MKKEILKDIEQINVKIAGLQKQELNANKTPTEIAHQIQRMQTVIDILNEAKEEIKDIENL